MSDISLTSQSTVFMLRATAHLGLQCQLAEQLLSKYKLKTVLVTNRPDDQNTYRRRGHNPDVFAEFIYFDDVEMKALTTPVPDEGALQAEVQRVESVLGIHLLDSIRADRQYGLGFISGVQTMRTPFMRRASYNQLVAVAIRMADFMAAALDHHKPAAIIGYPGTLPSDLLIEIAGRRGIPMRSLTVPRRKNYYYWAASRFGNPLDFVAHYSKVLDAMPDVPAEKQVVSDEESRPKGATVAIESRRKRASIRAFARNVASTIVSTLSFHWFRNPRLPMIYLLRDRLAAQANSWRSLRRALHAPQLLDTLDPRIPYIFFPLCFEPEASLLSDAIDAPTQLAIADWLARGAPTGWRIIIKEHPAQMLKRPPRFWEALRKYPNVLIAAQFESGEDIMRGARAVAVINGTLGIQAAEHMKPVLCFHHSYIGNVLPQIRVTQSFKEVREALADIARGDFSPTPAWRRAIAAWSKAWEAYEFQMTTPEFFASGRLLARVAEDEMAQMVDHLVRSLRPPRAAAL